MVNTASVLFVCLGNICRSPTAEAVFRAKAANAGLAVTVDSAGTHGYHIGKAPDNRSQQAGIARGYSFDGLKCRRVNEQDFATFDFVLAMDNSNLEDLRAMTTAEYYHKVKLFLSFADEVDDLEVPDPYYGGRKGFELVLDLIEKASDGLIEHLKSTQTA